MGSPYVITALTSQVRDKSRVNVHINGSYLFSLDVSQVVDLGVRVGAEYTEETLAKVRAESEFGRLYTRALEYVLMRPRSVYELSQYLYRKTRPVRTKSGDLRPGYDKSTAERVRERLIERLYVDDEAFAVYWVENRRLIKGASERLLRSELYAKGVATNIADRALQASERSDVEELRKVIQKKSRRYTDKQKFTQYLVRQGFSYSDVAEELSGWGA